MARIVCQALHRADRITLIWSEGEASFEPYHLDGQESANLFALADKIHGALASGATADAELAQLGHQLYRAVFCLGAADAGSAGTVRTWLTQLAQSNSIERIEFLGDAPARIPWNLLAEEASADFWGARFCLGAGRRVNALRSNFTQINPALLGAADNDLAQQVSAEQQAFLASLRGDARLVHTAGSLADALRKNTPDILLLLVRFKNGQLDLSGDTFGCADLQAWMAEAREGNPDPLVILMGVGDAAEQSAWQTLLAEASTIFSGLIANETLLPAGPVLQIGQQIAQRFAKGQQSLGEILRDLRRECGAAALAFTAFCPPQMRVVKEGATDVPPAETPIETAPLPDMPYRPFAAFDATNRSLFFGREEDTIRAALVMDRSDVNGVFLHGSAAVGKTSFLQAGLFPFLEQEGVGYRVLRDRSPVEGEVTEKDYPILILRCTNDLAGQFADALSAFCAQPLSYTTPTGSRVTVDLPAMLRQAVTGASPGEPSTAFQTAPAATSVSASPGEADEEEVPPPDAITARDLWIALRENKELLGDVLDAITRSLPYELVVAIDQGEELLTLVRSTQQQVRRQKALAMLMHASSVAPRCKIVYALRTEWLGQLVGLLADGKTPADWGSFYLRPLTESEMADALLWPTNREGIPYTEEIPHQKYGFSFEEGMAQQIVAEAIEAAGPEQQSALAIVQGVGALLYQKQVLERSQTAVRITDVKDIGGVKEALGRYLDLSIERLPLAKFTRKTLRELIGKLYTSHADGTVSRDLVPSGDLRNFWHGGAEPVEATVNLAAEQQGLFDIQQLLIGGREDVFVSLPQDSLARLGKKIDGERERRAHARAAVIDMLWVMIPLTFLAAAVTFYFTKHGFGADREAMKQEFLQEIQPQVQKIIRDHDEETARLQRQNYYGEILEADQALQLGEAIRARQILTSQAALLAAKDNKLPDLRGFEWRYLWRQLNQDRYLLGENRDKVTAVAISADSQRAASASADGTIQLWTLSDGKKLASIPGAKISVNAVAFAPDNKTLAAAGDDKKIHLWDISNLKAGSVEIVKELKTLQGHEGAVRTLAFGKDANTLASGGDDKAVILWDIAASKEKKKLQEHAAAVRTLGFSADGKTLVSAGDENQFVIYDVESAQKRLAAKTPYSAIAVLAIAPDGKTLASGGVETTLGSSRGAIRFWNVADGKETHKPIRHGSIVRALAFAPDGKAVISGGNDYLIRLWNVQTGTQQRYWIAHLDAINSLAFARDGSAMVSGSADQTIKVWDPVRSAGAETIQAHADSVLALALNSKNTLLASGARDGDVKLWDAKSGKLVKDLPAHQGAITALAFSSHKDATFLAVGTRDDKDIGEIKIWRIDDPAKQGVSIKEVHTLKEHKKGIACLAFSPAAADADLLISGSADQTVKLWDIKTGKEKASHAGHKDEVRCVAFSADGRNYASGGRDAIVCFYGLGSKEIRTLAGMQRGSIDTIALFPVRKSDDNDHVEIFTGILTGGADQAVAFWGYDQLNRDAAVKPVKLKVFHSHSQPVTSLAYSPMHNGTFFSASWDGSINLYDTFGQRLTLLGDQGPVRAIALAADQSFLVSAGNDGAIRFWRAYQKNEPPLNADKIK